MTKTRIMSANIKGGRSPHGANAGGPKLGLANAADRMSMAIRRCNAQGVTLLGAQECSGLQVRRVLERHPNWKPIVATANQRWPGATLGNALFIDARAWQLEEHREISAHTRTAGELHFVDAILRHETTGRAGRVIVAHFPAGKRSAARADKIACEQEIREEIRGEKLPTVILADCNHAGAFSGLGMLGARHKVDVALVRGLPSSRPRVHEGFVGTISDVHAAVSALVDLGRPE